MASHFSKQGKIRLFIACAVIFIAIGAASFWYFSIHTKTAAYSLQAVQQSLTNHDEKKFNQYVDVDNLLKIASDDLVAGMIDSGGSISNEAKTVIEGFARIIKAPLLTSCKEILHHYVLTGEIMSPEEAASLPIDANQIIDRFGFRDFNFSEVASLEVDKESGTATANVRLLQNKTGEPFVLRILLVKNDDRVWRVSEISNLKEFLQFVTQMRQGQVAAYLAESAEIQKKHDKSTLAAEEKVAGILKLGIMGNAALRQELAGTIQDNLLADWQQRKAELEALQVPHAAQPLHHLRLHICEARIAYSENYITWLKEQKPVSLRKANEKLREVRTMEHEAAVLLQQLQTKK